MNLKSFVFILVGFFILTNVYAQTNAGYELALTAFSASAANVQQNQLFTVTATPRNVGTEQFPGGQVGAALVGNNGRIVAVIGSANRGTLNVRSTGGAITINSFVPETVRAGQYQLMAVVRPTNGEWRVVTQTLQNVSSAINLTVTAGEANGGGYGIALVSLEADRTSVRQNELFTVSFRPHSLTGFPGGQFGAALVDNSGNILHVAGFMNRSSPISLGSRWTSANDPFVMNCFVPETIRAGQYRLRIVVRPEGGQWRVATLVNDGVPSAINFNVTAGEANGGGYGMALTVFSASTPHIQHYESFTVTATPRNVGLEQFPGGQIGAALVDNSGRIAAVIGTRTRSTLNAGSLSGAMEFSCTVPHTVNPGRYQLRAVIRPNGGQWRLATLALPNIPNSIDFEVSVNPNIVVAPLIQTLWSQGTPYNDLFPIVRASDGYFVDNNSRAVVGCGVTAAAIIMAFHRHPVRGSGQSRSLFLYPTNITVPSVNFNIAYDWNNMLNSYSEADRGTERQRSAVATLMYHISAAMSGANNIFIENFGYDRSFQYHIRRYYTDAQWEALIRSQLDAGLPVYYYGNYPADTPNWDGYHAFLVDGYDNQGRFHINWGWAGSYDGWYSLNNLNPTAAPESYDNEWIWINIKPNAGGIGSNEFALNGFTAGSTSVSRNARFTVTPVLFSFSFFPGGQAGIALVDNNNNIVAVIGSRNLSNNWQPGSRSAMEMNCTIPGTVNAGQYRLMAVTRIEGGEWKLVTLSDRVARVPNSINITVTGSGSAASQPAIQPATQPTAQQPTTQQPTTQQPTTQQPAAQQTLAVNTPATVTISNGRRVQFGFTAPSAGVFIFESSNNGTLDPVAFSAASGTTSAVIINDDGGEGRNFIFSQNLRAGEVFTFFAGVHRDNGTGSYTVNVQAVQSVTLTSNAITTITINNGQRIQLSFTAPSAGAYTFESSNNGTLDPVAFSAASGTGNINDDGGQGRNFRFTQNLRAGEVFTFFAGVHGNRGSGSYTVNVQGSR